MYRNRGGKMPKPRVTIVGLGLIGGSIGLALKRAKGEELEVIGHDKDYLKARKARKKGAVDKIHWNLISACEGSDIIVIATPVMAIKETMKVIAPYLKSGCLVTDTASIKGKVMEWAEEMLPDTVSFVGGDPIVVVEEEKGAGLEAARADLFDGVLYCLIPAPFAAPEAVNIATNLVHLLGATPYFLDAAEHDGLIAGVDHLPFVLATALLGITTQATSWREMRLLAGSAYESATRFASSDPTTYRDACLTNSNNIIRWIDACVEGLKGFKEAIAAEDAERLEEVFTEAMAARERWLRGRKERRWEEAVSMPQAPSFLRQMFGLGRWERGEGR
jgi:prephenate dehydrogenase